MRSDTYHPMLTVIDFLAVECLARVYPVSYTLEVNKRTALGVAVCIVYDVAVREGPNLAHQKVVDVGNSYVLVTTDRQ
jgi:hypothetical protein